MSGIGFKRSLEPTHGRVSAGLLAAVLAGWSLLFFASTWVAAAAPDRPSARFTVATYNVLYRNTNLTALVTTIRELDAGLICLQETTPAIESRLRAELTTHYPQQFYQTAAGSGGLALLSRWPLEDVRYLPPEKGIRGALLGRVKPPSLGIAVEFASVHLRTPQVSGLTALPGILAAFQKAGEVQDREIRRVYAAFKGDGPRWLMGDFNSFSFGPAQTFLKAQGWIDSLASVTEKPDEVPTWHDQRLGIGLGFRIDFLFHTSHFRTVSSRVVSDGSSDHRPVVSQLEWAGPQP